MSCFNKADELLEFTTTVYVILTMMNILGFKTIDDELDEEDHSLILSKVSNVIVNQIYPTTNTKEILKCAPRNSHQLKGGKKANSGQIS